MKSIMHYIPDGATRAVSRVGLKASKNSPRLLFVGGVVGVVGAAVLACRATLKVEDVLDDTAKDLDTARTIVYVSDRHRQQAVLHIYATSSFRLVKLYGPALILGSVSIAALTKSHDILTQRNAALSAAYAGLEATFGNYRERVQKELGEDREKEIYNDIQVVETKDGKSVSMTKQVGPNGGSQYARLYNEENRNYMPDPGMNIMTLRRRENYLNDKLRMQGHLFLNEAYEELGFDHSTAGSVVGWVWDPEHKIAWPDGRKRDSFVNFGIWSDSNRDRLHDFVVGNEGGIFLDFNVAGEIYKLLDTGLVRPIWAFRDKALGKGM